jgi:hypothetical protein
MRKVSVKVTDWDGDKWSALKPVMDRLATFDPLWNGFETDREVAARTGTRVVREVALWFDADKVRPEWVHGWACDAGFLAVVQS